MSDSPSAPSSPPPPSKPQWPEKVTLIWLLNNVPIQGWITLGALVASSVSIAILIDRKLRPDPTPPPNPVPIPSPTSITVTKVGAKVNGVKICSFVETGSVNDVLSTQPEFTAGITTAATYYTKTTQVNGKNGILLFVQVGNPAGGVGTSDFVYRVKLYQQDAKPIGEPVPYQEC